jgi:hypothetical protein
MVLELTTDYFPNITDHLIFLVMTLFSARYEHILGVFAKLRQVTISFVMWMSVCLSARLPVYLSVRMEQLGSHWTDFHES